MQTLFSLLVAISVFASMQTIGPTYDHKNNLSISDYHAQELIEYIKSDVTEITFAQPHAKDLHYQILSQNPFTIRQNLKKLRAYECRNKKKRASVHRKLYLDLDSCIQTLNQSDRRWDLLKSNILMARHNQLQIFETFEFINQKTVSNQNLTTTTRSNVSRLIRTQL